MTSLPSLCCEIEWDIKFSSNAKDAISLFIKQNPHFTNACFEDQQALLKQQFEYISDFTCRKHPSGISFITLHALDISAVINEKYVSTNNGDCLAASWFDQTYLSSLPALCVHADQQNLSMLDASCIYFIKQAPWHKLHEYLVEWHSPVEQVFISKKQPLFSLIASNERIPSSDFLQACTTLMQELEAKGSFKQNKKWRADTRFRGQIVVYAQEKKGVSCGTVF